jgi:mevalonate kinase
MPVTSATAPGKIILFGEHAVVYDRPAIAVPVTQVRAKATVEEGETTGVRLRAPDLGRDYWLKEAAAAVIRALSNHLGLIELAADDQVSAITYQVEKLLHGTPSGIDNTVVSYERPVYFIRRRPQNHIETLKVAKQLRLLVADTGVISKTKDVVGDVRKQWQTDPGKFDRIFDNCGWIAEAARGAIEKGEVERLGELMAENQIYLREMTVSSPDLERLIEAAELNGALGAKLSGAGRGGNMIALVNETGEETVRLALSAAGAVNVLTSVLT